MDLRRFARAALALDRGARGRIGALLLARLPNRQRGRLGTSTSSISNFGIRRLESIPIAIPTSRVLFAEFSPASETRFTTFLRASSLSLLHELQNAFTGEAIFQKWGYN